MAALFPGPGWVMVTRTGGFIGWAIRLLTRSTVNHAAVHIGGRLMVEMNPSGAACADDDEYAAAVWIRPPGTDEQLAAMAAAAHQLWIDHERYSFIDIAAQAAYRLLHIRPAFLARFISSDRTMVCSQSVDWCAQQAGIVLFDDGRLNGLVSPGDLLDAARAGGWPLIRFPTLLGEAGPELFTPTSSGTVTPNA